MFIDPNCLENLPEINKTDESRLRTEYFLHLIKTSERSAESVNPFLAEWLWRTSLAMLTATAYRNRCSLQEARTMLRSRRTQAAERVLDLIFQVRPVDPEEDTNTRLKKKILDLWNDPRICGRLEELEENLWGAPDTRYAEWLRQRIAATIAQAFRTAAVGRLNDVSEDDLMIDLIWSQDGTGCIYLTETSSGGLGQIELVVRDLIQYPDRFHEGFRHALAYCPRDYVSRNLIQAVEYVASETILPLHAAFAQVRNSRGFRALEAARDTLQTALEDAGLPGSRTMVVSVHTRLLGYGTSAKTDKMIHLLNKAIDRHSNRLGLNLDPRVFAYLCANYPPARRRLARILEDIGGRIPEAGQIYAVLQHFLFAGCKDSCPECLDHPNRFNDFGRPSRELAKAWLGHNIPQVSAGSEDWVHLALLALQDKGCVEVSAGTSRITEVAETLQAVLAQELEVDYLLLPISITIIKRSRAEWKITLEVKDSSNDH